ncbi:MAG: tetratricopeptide (TPR) repeat protein [Alteromonadaceae bacterium]|jgi:tetratricopeptide (TPR) repeat protein
MKSLLALGLLITTSVLASQAEIDTIESAYISVNSNVLTEIAKQSDHYIKALAYYRLSILHNVHSNKDQAIATLVSTISELESIVASTPGDDESWALLSQSYGLMISYQPQLGAEYGQKSFDAAKKAKNIAPNNPRISLFQGIMSFNTPAIYGGSKHKAVELLNNAIELFEYDRNSNNYWGEAEAYVWRGLTYRALNDNEKATADFKMALQLKPNFDWAKMLLKNNS